MAKEYDLIIIGGGCAGMSAAQYGSRANLSVAVVEAKITGGQALLINDIENYPGIYESVNGFDFSETLKRQATEFGAEFITTEILEITKEGDYFTLKTSREPLTAPTVILATGAERRKLNVPGEIHFNGKGVSYCATCDGAFFREKRIIAVGGGDAACDEALYLSRLTDKVTMIHRRDRFRAQKSLADRVIKNPHITPEFNTIIREIKGDTKVTSVILKNVVTNEEREVETDAVFVFVGALPNTGLLPNLKKDEGGYIVTDQNMETGMTGLFAVGDVRATPFRQLITAASDGAVAAHRASAYIDELQGRAYK